ncbi:MAG: SDR family NAD(P)-dependent oxidoreductase [Anaerolineae bacterium]
MPTEGPARAVLPKAVSLRALPAPDAIAIDFPADHVCLVVSAGAGNGRDAELAAELARRLRDRGWTVVVAVPASGLVRAQETLSGDSIAVEAVDLAGDRCESEVPIRRMVERITQTHGSVAMLVYLSPWAPANTDDLDPFDPRELALLRLPFLLAKHLQPSLTAAATAGYAAFVTVTHLDGMLGLGGALRTPPVRGGIAGLTKTLRLEWPEVYCRAVDLDPNMGPERAADLIVGEIEDPNRLIAEVGWSERGRVTPEAAEPLPGIPAAASVRVDDTNAVFLVSGGAKGITADCVIALARRSKSRFILVGRSSYDAGAEPAWARNALDGPSLKRAAMAHLQASGERPTPQQVQSLVVRVLSRREIRRTLRSVDEAGGLAVYAQADVTDADALRQAVSTAVEQLGPVTGIIHGAGVLADSLVQHKTVADFERVLSVKVDGLRNLLACVPSDQLKLVVLFSSVAGFYGNAGQAGYAVANEVLNKVAHWLAAWRPACRVLAVDWGPWDGGMVTPALRRQLELHDVPLIPVDEGAALLVDLVTAYTDDAVDIPSQVVVGSAMPSPERELPDEGRTFHIHRHLSLEANPFLRDHVIGGRAVLPTVCAAAWMVSACEQLYPGYRCGRVDDYRALKGIVFDEGLADGYTLEITAQPARAHGEPVFDAVIRSETADGRPRYHYTATVALCREMPSPAELEDARRPMPHQNLEGEGIEGAQLYREDTLFHGPCFQGIERVLDIRDAKGAGVAGLTTRCQMPPIPWEVQGQFPVQTLNPYLVDAQLQSLLVWSKRFIGYGGLPLRIRESVLYRPLHFGETTYVSMQVKDATNHRLVADVTVWGADGQRYMVVRGAEITLSERLNALFRQNVLKAGAMPGGETSQ